MPAPYTGGCQCGSVRYVLTTEPIRLAACHCKKCQRQSGSAFGMAMPVTKDSLSVTGLTNTARKSSTSSFRRLKQGIVIPDHRKAPLRTVKSDMFGTVAQFSNLQESSSWVQRHTMSD